MIKITKKFLIEEAIKRYSLNKINEAIRCNVKVITKDGELLETNFQLVNRGLKKKADVIRTEIRGFLKNTSHSDSNKKIIGDTSSENIENIKISLKFK